MKTSYLFVPVASPEEIKRVSRATTSRRGGNKYDFRAKTITAVTGYDCKFSEDTAVASTGGNSSKTFARLGAKRLFRCVPIGNHAQWYIYIYIYT